MDDDDLVSVALTPMQWAGVAAALQAYIRGPEMRHAKQTRLDCVQALREIDRIMMGSDEPAPLDDLL